jgi:hypothetical protein
MEVSLLDVSYYGGLGVGIAIIIWVLCIGAAVGLAFIPATIARNKGYSFGGFWALGFFFFLVGLIVALCLEDKNAPYRQPYQQYQPPYQQPYGQPYQQPYQAPNAQPQTVSCPGGLNSIAADSVFCPKCGTKLK